MTRNNLPQDTDLVEQIKGLSDQVDRLSRSAYEGGVLAGQYTLTEWPIIEEADHTGVGGPLDELLDRRGRGIEGRWGQQTSNAPSTNTTGGVGVFEIVVYLHAGRLYKVCTCPLHITSTVANDLAEVQARYTYSAGEPAEPTISSPVIGRSRVNVGSASSNSRELTKLWAPASSGNYRILLTYSRVSGTGTLTMLGGGDDSIQLWVEDVGSAVDAQQQVNNGGGGVVTQPPKQYKLTWNSTWVRTFKGNGSYRTDTTDAVQGYNSYNGNQQAAVGFTGGSRENGQTILVATAGATIKKVEVYGYANHWHNNSGGVGVFGIHDYESVPSRLGPGALTDLKRRTWTTKTGGGWVDLSAFNPQGWVSGDVRGVMLGPGPSTASTYYGRFNGGSGFVLSITFVK